MRLNHVLFRAAAACLALVAQAAPTLPGIGAAMQAVVDERQVSGAVTLVATKDKVVHLEATGLADLENQKPMEPDAMFWIASTTKVVTGVAVLMCQDDGKLKVTDPVANYIPEFASLKTPSGKPANLTIEQLLTHTSGAGEINRANYASVNNLSELIASYFPAPPMLFEPGEHWKYSGITVDTAGRIVEIVSGKTFDRFVQERLFDPLGMKDTTFYPNETQQRRMAACYRKNISTGGLELQPQPIVAMLGRKPVGKLPPLPVGGLYSTAQDLGQLGQMLLNGGRWEGKRYLTDAAYKTLTSVHTGDLQTGFSRAQLNQVLGWGLGVYVLRAPASHGGVSSLLSPGTFGHPGALGTHLMVDPVKGVTYVMMVQRANLSDNFENLVARAFLQAATNALEKPAP
jgi:CubicO group peptidase (beta-lactamase class C family)